MDALSTTRCGAKHAHVRCSRPHGHLGEHAVIDAMGKTWRWPATPKRSTGGR